MGIETVNFTPTPPPPPPPGGDQNKKKAPDSLVVTVEKVEDKNDENKPNKPKSKKVSFICNFDVGQILRISRELV